MTLYIGAGHCARRSCPETIGGDHGGRPLRSPGLRAKIRDACFQAGLPELGAEIEARRSELFKIGFNTADVDKLNELYGDERVSVSGTVFNAELDCMQELVWTMQ
jgi:hypothetical protein